MDFDPLPDADNADVGSHEGLDFFTGVTRIGWLLFFLVQEFFILFTEVANGKNQWRIF